MCSKNILHAYVQRFDVTFLEKKLRTKPGLNGPAYEMRC